MEKLNNKYSINLDDDTAEAVEKLAELTRRKPAEVLRLLVVDQIFEQLAQAAALTGTTKKAQFYPNFWGNAKQ